MSSFKPSRLVYLTAAEKQRKLEAETRMVADFTVGPAKQTVTPPAPTGMAKGVTTPTVFQGGPTDSSKVSTPVSEAIAEAQQAEADAAQTVEPTKTAVEIANERADRFGFGDLFSEPDQAALDLVAEQEEDRRKLKIRSEAELEALADAEETARSTTKGAISAAASKLGQGREGAIASGRTSSLDAVKRGETEIQVRLLNKVRSAKNEIAFREKELAELHKKEQQNFTLADMERESKINESLAEAKKDLLDAELEATEGAEKATQRMYDLVKSLGGVDEISKLSGSKFASLVASQTGANEKDALAFHSLAIDLADEKTPEGKDEILSQIEKMFGDEPTANQRNIATLLALPGILGKIEGLDANTKAQIIQSASIAAGVGDKIETPAQKSSRESVEALTRYRDEQTSQLAQKNLRNQGIPVIQDGQGGIIIGIADGEKIDNPNTERDESQCGALVNDFLGVPGLFGDTYDSKRNNVNSQVPSTGAIGVLDTGDDIGHVFIVEQVFADGSQQIAHSNYSLDNKFHRDTWTADEMRANGLVGYFSGEDQNEGEGALGDFFANLGKMFSGATPGSAPAATPPAESAMTGVQIRDKFLAGDKTPETAKAAAEELKGVGFTDEQVMELFAALKEKGEIDFDF